MKKIFNFEFAVTAIAFFCMNANIAHAGGITVPSGGTLDMNGVVDVAGGVDNGGTLNLNSATVNLDGDWVNTDTVNSGASEVNLNSAAQGQSVTTGGGTSSFNILTITNSNASGVTFADALFANDLNAGTGVQQLLFATTGIHTIFNTFNVNGSSGSLITVDPSTASTDWNLDAPIFTTVDFLDVSHSQQAAGKTISAVDSIDGGNNNEWWAFGGPTVVELVAFTAQPGLFLKVITLEWETAAEIDNAGFHLWRSETEDGDYERITSSIIAAQGGSTFGAEYSYRDRADVIRGQTYYYKLEDIEFDGSSEFHGPVSVTAR